MTRCALCHKLIAAEEFAGQDGLGRPICTLCEEALALRHGRDTRWVESLVAAAALAAVCTAIAWFAWGCATPSGGDRYQPWRGESPITPPGWTNGTAESR